MTIKYITRKGSEPYTKVRIHITEPCTSRLMWDTEAEQHADYNAQRDAPQQK